MYRLVGPNLVFFIPLIIIGSGLAAACPNYFGTTRILSFTSLVIGEIGMSFIPVLALFPRVTPGQGILLAVIYFITNLIMCFAAWCVYTLGGSANYAFLLKDNQFHVNIYSLFISNLFSLASLVLCYRLAYDEELTKEFHKKRQQAPKGKFGFSSFRNPLLRRPEHETRKSFGTTSSQSQKIKQKDKTENFFDTTDDKPFEFAVEEEVKLEDLPEESKGELFSPFEQESTEKSDFFDQEPSKQDFPTSSHTEKPASLKSPFEEKSRSKTSTIAPPHDIKNDLAAIFEQYSSLNAIKKLTTTKAEKLYRKKRRTKRPYVISKEEPEISVQIEGEDIQEASFKQISDKEELQELKETFKKELQDEVSTTLQQKAGELEEVKQTFKKELQDEVLQALNEKSKQLEKSLKEKEVFKEDILSSLKEIKGELIQSIKEEIKTKFEEKKSEEKPKLFEEPVKQEEKITEEQPQETLVTEDDQIELPFVDNWEQTLININKESNVMGSLLLNKDGKIISENSPEKQLPAITHPSLLQIFTSVNEQINNTNQGSLCHLLLESENGTLVLGSLEDKILTVYTKGTGEIYTGQLLRALSKVEERN